MTLSHWIPGALVAALACGPTPPRSLPTPQVAPNAPADRPAYATDTSGAHRLQQLVERCAERAHATYPAVRARYLHGLPANQTLFVTINLRDAEGRTEGVFLAVDEIRADTVRGRIWNQIGVVHGFQYGQALAVPESEVLDWTISHPDGTEEGNYVGKAIDEIQAGREPSC
jgi:hypothetical protein